MELTMECQKLYEIKLSVKKKDNQQLFKLIQENYEEAADGGNPFKNGEEISNFIRNGIRTTELLHGCEFSWRTCEVQKGEKYLLVAQFPLTRKELKFVRVGEEAG